VVAVGAPHHVTQRGNNRQRVFHSQQDDQLYLALLAERAWQYECRLLGYCLMPNHVHLVAVPGRPDSVAKLLRVTHHRYALRINTRNDWQGHLWQERFHSFVMDEPHLLAAVRYIEMNPVRAGIPMADRPMTICASTPAPGARRAMRRLSPAWKRCPGGGSAG
jgi:putative transposase